MQIQSLSLAYYRLENRGIEAQSDPIYLLFSYYNPISFIFNWFKAIWISCKRFYIDNLSVFIVSNKSTNIYSFSRFCIGTLRGLIVYIFSYRRWVFDDNASTVLASRFFSAFFLWKNFLVKRYIFNWPLFVHVSHYGSVNGNSALNIFFFLSLW